MRRPSSTEATETTRLLSRALRFLGKVLEDRLSSDRRPDPVDFAEALTCLGRVKTTGSPGFLFHSLDAETALVTTRSLVMAAERVVAAIQLDTLPVLAAAEAEAAYLRLTVPGRGGATGGPRQ